MMPDKLAMQAIKYQSRDGWSHRDVLRLAHPRAGNSPIIRWMIGGSGAMKDREVGRAFKRSYAAPSTALPPLIVAAERAKQADEKLLVSLIAQHNLPREAVPTEQLNSVAVWDALLQKMPLTAMIRNLGKMTAVGLLKPLSESTRLVTTRLVNEKALKQARVHPLQILLALRTYQRGAGLKGSLVWTPVPAIVSALDEAFYLSFANADPCGKPLLIALDVSGSMGTELSGLPISSAEAVAALSLVHAQIEPQTHIFGFADSFRELGIHGHMTIEEATKRAQDHNFGSTDCSLAVQYAINNRLKVGGFIVMSDNECNAGRHFTLALKEYRQRFVEDARMVVVGTTATNFTINDPKDPLGLDCAGFDAGLPPVVADFIRGTETPKAAEED